MAGYNPFQGRPYPTRQGFGGMAPDSQVVQSDTEFGRGWDEKIAGIPSRISDGAELNPTASGYDAGAASDYWSRLTAIPFGTPTGSLYQIDPIIASPAFDHFNRDLGVGTSYQGTYNERDNPAYIQALKDRTSAETQRTEAQFRNQQAYDTNLMGNGAIGGVLPSDYSSPTYGQVTGRQGGLGGLGGFGGADLTGVDQAQQTGAYMGGAGAYNPNPFSAGSFQNKNPWEGF